MVTDDSQSNHLAESEVPPSWAAVVNPNPSSAIVVPIKDAESELCPFGAVGECRYGEYCAYLHGDICELCGQALLHPTHEAQRKEHRAVRSSQEKRKY